MITKILNNVAIFIVNYILTTISCYALLYAGMPREVVIVIAFMQSLIVMKLLFKWLSIKDNK